MFKLIRQNRLLKIIPALITYPGITKDTGASYPIENGTLKVRRDTCFPNDTRKKPCCIKARKREFKKR